MRPTLDARLDAYADLTLRLGLDLQPGQRLVVQGADVTTADFFRRLTERAYALGARRVDILWRDESEIRARVAHAPLESLDEVAPHVPALLNATTAADVALRVSSLDPHLFSGLDPARVARYQRAVMASTADFTRRLRSHEFPSSLIGVPTAAWARAVFPGQGETAALQKLWDAVLTTVRLDAADPDGAWRVHLSALRARRDWLNARAFSALHFRGPGTDLVVGLADAHLWQCIDNQGPGPQRPLFNLPSEEVFTAPHRARVSGVASAARPLNLGGTLIEGLRVHFHEGRVTDVHARTGEAALRQVLATDEGAMRLGEVALVAQSSPLAQTGLLYHSVLFDENAASHLAFGMAYPSTVRAAPDAFEAAGGNRSSTHVDWMIGSPHVDVDGVHANGEAEPVMRSGEWCITP